jgi:hypothetical protein
VARAEILQLRSATVTLVLAVLCLLQLAKPLPPPQQVLLAAL